MESLCSPSHGLKSFVSTLVGKARRGSNSNLDFAAIFGLSTGVRACGGSIYSRPYKTINRVRLSNLANRQIRQVYNKGIEESVLEEKMVVDLPLKYSLGEAHPLGPSAVDGGINFSMFSQHASSVILCISISERNDVDKLLEGTIEVPLDPQKNKTGDIWHICVEVDTNDTPILESDGS